MKQDNIPEAPLRVGDEDTLAWAIAETINSMLRGETPLDAERVKRRLYYELNPWCTEPSFRFMNALSAQLTNEKKG